MRKLSISNCLFLAVFFCHISFFAIGQKPTISSIDKSRGFYKDVVTIKGSNFGTDLTKLKVYFGPVSGKIKSITNQLMRVIVPAGATFENISVTNISNGLTGYSPSPFLLSFGGAVGLSSSNFAPEEQRPAFESADGFGLYDLALGDFNGDGLSDVICSSQKSGTLSLLINGSSPGTLSASKTIANLKTNISALHVVAGDLNGDGRLDVVATENEGNRVIIYRNNGTTGGVINWSNSTVTLLGRKVKRVAIADIDLDGKPDIIVSDKTVNAAGNSIVTILPNRSSTTAISFGTSINLTVPQAASTDALEIKDLNGDGSPEIITSQFLTDNCNVFIFSNKSSPGNFNLGDITTLTVNNAVVNIRMGDLDGDQKPDLVATRYLGSDIVVFRNTSSSSQFSFANPQLFKTSISPWGLDLGDLDGDGKMDVVVNSLDNTVVSGNNRGTLTVFNNQSTVGSINFATPLTLPSKFINRHVKIGDIDGDAKPDIVFASVDDDKIGLTSSFISVFRNTSCLIPSLAPSGPLSVCTGNPVKLLAPDNPGTTYVWTNSGAAVAGQTTPTLNVTASGIYAVTANNGSCSQKSNDVSVTISGTSSSVTGTPLPTSNSPVCTGDALTLQINDVGATEYRWRGPNAYVASGLTASPAATNFTADNAGIYVVDIINGGTLASGGCVARTDSVTVQNTNIPTFTIATTGSNTICANTPKILSASPVFTSGFTYQWFDDNGPLAGKVDGSLSVTKTGNYSVQVASTQQGCTPKTTAPTKITVLSLPVPTFTVSPTPSCTGTSLTFANQSVVDANGSATYAWTFGDNVTSNLISPTHTYTTGAAFVVTLSVNYTGITGCAVTSNKTITVASAVKPLISISTPGICAGETKQLKVDGAFTTITWSTGTTGASISITQPGTYSASTVDANGCPSTAELAVTQNPVPTLAITADNTTIAPGQSVQLTVTGADTYKWTPAATLDNAAIASPKATPLITTTYFVDALTNAGCSARDSISIKVDGGNSVDLKVTNVFSPNGDGRNDLWVIPGIESYQDCTLSLYDKNGSKVLEQKGYRNDWDGNYKGQPAPQGTYYYVLICTDKKPLTGSVLLAR